MNFERNHGGAQFSGGFAGGKTTGRFEVEDFAKQINPTGRGQLAVFLPPWRIAAAGDRQSPS
jgi:hypothetical protein